MSIGVITAMAKGDDKLRIQDAEFALLIGGPYDGLKLSRYAKKSSLVKDSQIGLPTPQYLDYFDSNATADSDLGVDYEIKFDAKCYNVEEKGKKYYYFSGDEVIAVYKATGVKRKYCDVFEKIPDSLVPLSKVLNVNIFKFDYYTTFDDIDS
jgi:hypothetical protein